MCCLKYEHDNYESVREELPAIGKVVVTSYGEGKVTGINAGTKSRLCATYLMGGKPKELPLDDVVIK